MYAEKFNRLTILSLLTIIISVLIYSNNSIALVPDSTNSSSILLDRAYYNSKYAFKLEVPSDWEIVDQKNGIKINNEDGGEVDFSVNDLPSGDLQDYVDNLINERNGGNDEFRLLDLNQTVISQNPSVKATYTFESEPDKDIKKVLKYWTASNDKLYSITYMSDTEKYDAHLSTANALIESLQLNVPFDSSLSNNATNENTFETAGYFSPPSDNSGLKNDTSINNEVKENDELLCNKLLETCNLPEMPSTIGNENEIEKTEEDTTSQEIAKKYFETPQPQPEIQPQFDMNAPTTESINKTEPAPNQINQTETTSGFDLQHSSAPSATNLQTYENSTMGVRVLYPADWQNKDESNQRFYVLEFGSPKENINDTIRERMILRINKMISNLTLDEYSNKVNETTRNSSDFSVIDFRPSILSDNPAYVMKGVSKHGTNNVNVRDEWTIKDGTVYRIIIYSEAGKNSFPLVEQKIIDSFKITK